MLIFGGVSEIGGLKNNAWLFLIGHSSGGKLMFLHPKSVVRLCTCVCGEPGKAFFSFWGGILQMIWTHTQPTY